MRGLSPGREMLHEDYRDIFLELFAAQADFLVIGAFAMAGHGMMRTTGDLDLWVRPNPENADRVWAALARYGAPVGKLTRDELSRPGLFFQIGLAPRRIDILTDIDGVGFEEAWDARVYRMIDDVRVPVISRDHLLANKRATGRPKDQGDVAWIESRMKKEQRGSSDE
jgi:hypothetical protein